MRETGSFFNSLIARLDWRLILILILYVFVGFSLLGYYQYQINPDALSYIAIAKEYLNGSLFGAVNAYSGPLISWLLLPFLIFSQSPSYALFSAKVLSLIVGFFTIIGIRQLSYRFEMGELIRSTILLCAIPIVLYFALSVITPDLLVVCFLVYYFTVIFNPKYSNRLFNGVLCGVLGAFAFFGKSFIFPFFIAHFLIMNIFYYLKSSKPETRKKVFKNLIVGFLVFLMISGVWVGLISSKEGKLTFGTAGEYNYKLVGPQSHGFPQSYEGLSAPGDVQKLESWSPFSSWSNFKYQLKLINANSMKTLNLFQYFSFLSALILLIYLLLFLGSLNSRVNILKQQNLQENVWYPLITVIIYSGGYLPVLVEERYLWPIYVLLILMGGYLVNILFKLELFNKINKLWNLKLGNVIKAVILLIFAYSFIIMPINSLYSSINTGKDVYSISNTLQTQYGVHGNIATNSNLTETQYISFYLNTTSYGQAQENITDTELQPQLEKYNINYYFIWGDSASHAIVGYHEITGGNLKNLMIYAKN